MHGSGISQGGQVRDERGADVLLWMQPVYEASCPAVI